HAVADDRRAPRAEDAGGQQVEGGLLLADDDRAPRVVAPVELDDVVALGAELVGGLPLALVAPLASDDAVRWHGDPCRCRGAAARSRDRLPNAPLRRFEVHPAARPPRLDELTDRAPPHAHERRPEGAA